MSDVLCPPNPMSAVLDRGRIATADRSAAAIERSPMPPVLRNNALMDAVFRNLTRFFAFLVFSLLAAILVSLLIGSRPSLEKFGLGFLGNENWEPVKEDFGALVPVPGTPQTPPISLLSPLPQRLRIS